MQMQELSLVNVNKLLLLVDRHYVLTYEEGYLKASNGRHMFAYRDGGDTLFEYAEGWFREFNVTGTDMAVDLILENAPEDGVFMATTLGRVSTVASRVKLTTRLVGGTREFRCVIFGEDDEPYIITGESVFKGAEKISLNRFFHEIFDTNYLVIRGED